MNESLAAAAGGAISETDLPGLERIYRGKVRDVYQVDADRLLFVATDRISAFDRVLGTAIPGKGVVLTQISNFWFSYLSEVVPNHLLATRAADMPAPVAAAARGLGGRAVLVRKLEVVPIECIVRGSLAGSVQKEYERTGSIQGVRLPPGIPLGGAFPEPIFTPSTKEKEGHDRPLTPKQLVDLVGAELAHRLEEVSLAVFHAAARRCAKVGLILCDTKLEIGRGEGGGLVLADEALTPDSSRFFKADEHVPGRTPVPWDKQLVRDYLKTLPAEAMEAEQAPTLPAEVVAETAARYRAVYELLAGRTLEAAVAEATA